MSRHTICVTEDNDVVRNLLVSLLRQSGYDVVSAADGEQALTVLDGGKVSVLITDIVMPNREGLDLILTVKERFPHIRILAISGAGDLRGEKYLQMAQKLGADACLAKPFSNAELLGRLTDLLGAARS